MTTHHHGGARRRQVMRGHGNASASVLLSTLESINVLRGR